MAFETPDDLTPGTVRRSMVMPADPRAWEAISGALSVLIEPANWEEVGTLTPQECAAFFTTWLFDWFESDEPITPP